MYLYTGYFINTAAWEPDNTNKELKTTHLNLDLIKFLSHDKQAWIVSKALLIC